MVRKTVVLVFGTRPEAIKLAPVVRALKSSNKIQPIVVHSGQHRDLADSSLRDLELTVDIRLDCMSENQSLIGLHQRLLGDLHPVFQSTKPHWVLVQGDTMTAWSATWAAFLNKIPVGHIEAGLRSGDLGSPYPEEANRKLISALASRHYAPTERGKRSLLREGIAPETILVTGNTVVDALHWMQPRLNDLPPPKAFMEKRTDQIILTTLHRRENFGTGLEQICLGIRDFLDTPRASRVGILFPVHPNPHVQSVVRGILGTHPRVSLIPPLGYIELLQWLSLCDLVLTDSGGLQEETPSFQKRVLIARTETERPEVLESGFGTLIGVSREGTLDALLHELDLGFKKPMGSNPFGDGHASQRIQADLCDF